MKLHEGSLTALESLSHLIRSTAGSPAAAAAAVVLVSVSVTVAPARAVGRLLPRLPRMVEGGQAASSWPEDGGSSGHTLGSSVTCAAAGGRAV